MKTKIYNIKILIDKMATRNLDSSEGNSYTISCLN